MPDTYYDCAGDCLNNSDGDTLCDEFDPCPDDASNPATDTDSDGVLDCVDACPNDAADDSDGDGVCDDDEIEGCTDSTACNFDASATEDDGSCEFPTIWYLDNDGDGLGFDGSGIFSIESCDEIEGYVCLLYTSPSPRDRG